MKITLKEQHRKNAQFRNSERRSCRTNNLNYLKSFFLNPKRSTTPSFLLPSVVQPHMAMIQYKVIIQAFGNTQHTTLTIRSLSTTPPIGEEKLPHRGQNSHPTK